MSSPLTFDNEKAKFKPQAPHVRYGTKFSTKKTKKDKNKDEKVKSEPQATQKTKSPGQNSSKDGKNNKKPKFRPQAPHERRGLKFSTQNYFENGRKDEKPGKLQPEALPFEKVKKYLVGKRPVQKTRTMFHSYRMEEREELIEEVAQASARGEILCTEDTGLLEAEKTNDISQWDIKTSVDEMTQQKIFDINLNQFGPYRMDYTRNGRHLLIGGQKGHIAAFDWQAKKLHCEINVMETISDVKWLHQETMFAVAQRQWTYVYDNQGIELHCLKHLDHVQRLEFLPYHFLLVSASAKGYLSYLDVSVGKEVAGVPTRKGRLDVMTTNPQSAVVNLGHSDGTVTFWIPSMKEPAAKLLCHTSGLRDLSVDATGRYMATTAMDRRLKIFDLRMYKELSKYQYSTRLCPNHVDFSQKGLLAVSRNRVVEVYKDMTELSKKPDQAFMYHTCDRDVVDLAFCPYEDVLGLGHREGFTSVVIPGAGEANFDARESNPFETKSQRKETEVHMLLDKVKPEMITLDGEICQIDTKTKIEMDEEREKNKYLVPDRIDFTPKHRMKGASSGLKMVQRKDGHREDVNREAVRDKVRTMQIEGKFEERNKNRKDGATSSSSVLDRLKSRNADR